MMMTMMDTTLLAPEEDRVVKNLLDLHNNDVEKVAILSRLFRELTERRAVEMNNQDMYDALRSGKLEGVTGVINVANTPVTEPNPDNNIEMVEYAHDQNSTGPSSESRNGTMKKASKSRNKRSAEDTPQVQRNKKSNALTSGSHADPNAADLDPELVQRNREEKDQTNDEGSQNQGFTTPSRVAKIPPLMISTDLPYPILQDMITNIIGSRNFEFKSQSGDKYKLQLKSKDEFKKTVERLKVEGIQFHTNMLREDIPFKYVIKGIPLTLDPDEVKHELECNGFTIHKITRLVNREGNDTSILIVQLPKTEKNKEIFQLKSVSNLIVNVERLKKKKGPSQCHNCQGFFHSQDTCYKLPNCVKCAGNHHTSKCDTKKWENQVKCVNCQKVGHPANYKGCEKFPKPKMNRQNLKNLNQNRISVKEAQPQGDKQPSQNTAETNNSNQGKTQTRSYAMVAKAKANNPPPEVITSIVGQLAQISNQVAQLTAAITKLQIQYGC